MLTQTDRLCQGDEAVDRFFGPLILGLLHRANDVAVDEEQLKSDQQCHIRPFR